MESEPAPARCVQRTTGTGASIDEPPPATASDRPGRLVAREATGVLDDAHLVRDNPLVARGPAAIPHVFAGRGDASLNDRYGRLTVASFALEAPLWKQADGTLDPSGFHLGNLLLHGLCALLLFRFLLGVLPGRAVVALAGALVFAVHPLHTGTVAALTGRSQLLALLFSLLSAFAWRSWAGRRPAWIPVAALVWLLALEASPAAIGVPLVLFLLDRACPPVGAEPRHPYAHVSGLVFAVPLAVFLATWGGVPSLGIDLPSQPALERVAIGVEGLARVLLAIVVPVGLRGDHTDEALPGAGYPVGTAALGLVIAVALLTCLAAGRAVRGRAGLFSVAWLATVALALPAFLVLPPGSPLETSFAYLVGVPLFAGAGAIAAALLPRGGTRPGLAFATARGAMVAALALIALVGLTHREALGWRDDTAFHERLLDRNPNHVRAMVRLTRSQRRAAEELRLAAAALPARSTQRAAYLRLRLDALAESAMWGQRAVRHDAGRRNANAWRELGFTQLASDKTAVALRSLETALELDPLLRRPVAELLAEPSEAQRARAAEMYFAIARCRESMGSRETAADAFLAAWRLDESRDEYLRVAGASLCRVDRYAEGIPLLLEARRRSGQAAERAELDGIIANARRSAREIAARLVAEGEAKQAESTDATMREAVILYERALEVNPASPRALIRAGWLRGMWFGNYTLAEARFRAAEELLRQGGVPETDPDWRQLRDFRAALAKQKAEEED